MPVRAMYRLSPGLLHGYRLAASRVAVPGSGHTVHITSIDARESNDPRRAAGRGRIPRQRG